MLSENLIEEHSMRSAVLIMVSMIAVFLISVNPGLANSNLQILGPFPLGVYYASRPNIHVDQNGNVHLTWLVGNGPGVGYKKILTSQWDEANLPEFDTSIPEAVPGAASSYQYGHPRVSASKEGNPVIVYAPRGASAVGPILYNCFENGAWGDTDTMEYNRRYNVDHVNTPDIAVDDNNNMWIIFTEVDMTAELGNVALVTAPFGNHRFFTGYFNLAYSSCGRIDVDPLGNLHCTLSMPSTCVTWAYRKRFPDGTWTDLENWYNTTSCIYPVEVSGDHNGDPWCAVGGTTDEGVDNGPWWVDEVRMCHKIGNQWQIYDPVDHGRNYGNFMSTFPGMAVNEAGGLIVWFDTLQTYKGNQDLLGYVHYFFTDGINPPQEGSLPGYFYPFCGDGEWCGEKITTDSTSDGFYVVSRQGNDGLMLWKFKTNSPPQILLGGFTQNTFSALGYEIGGPLNLIAIVDDPNGLNDIAAVKVLHPETFDILFDLHDDGLNGDLFPGDGIYGIILEDEYNLPGIRQSLVIAAFDSKGAVSDLYPYLTIHGNQQSCNPYEQLQWEPSWSRQYSDMMNSGDGDWSVFMAGYLETNLTCSCNSWFNLIAWAIPTSPLVTTNIDRVEMLYQDIYAMDLPFLFQDPGWGAFYGLTIPIPGDALPPELGGFSMELQLRAVDSNGKPSTVWPYLEIPVPPTPTPTPTFTPTNTPTPTCTPTCTPTFTPTRIPTNTPTCSPTDTPIPPTDTPEITPTETPTETSTPTPRTSPTLSLDE